MVFEWSKYDGYLVVYKQPHVSNSVRQWFCGIQLAHVRKNSLESEVFYIKKSVFIEEIEKSKENLPFLIQKFRLT